MTSETDPYNDGYTHEVMHTAHVLLDTWGDHVFDTRTCDEFPDLKDAAEKASEAMYYFYQLAGQKFNDEDPPPTIDDIARAIYCRRYPAIPWAEASDIGREEALKAARDALQGF